MNGMISIPRIFYALLATVALTFLVIEYNSLEADSGTNCYAAGDAAYSSCISQSNYTCADECQCTYQKEVAECACFYGTNTQAFRTCRRQALQRIIACDIACHP